MVTAESVMVRRRVDLLLVERGLVASRSKAQALILAGSVRTEHGRRIDKAGEQLADDAVLEVDQKLPYVSRGGLKLAGALDGFDVDVGILEEPEAELQTQHPLDGEVEGRLVDQPRVEGRGEPLRVVLVGRELHVEPRREC